MLFDVQLGGTTEDRIIIQRDKKSSLEKAQGLYFSAHAGELRQVAWGLSGVREIVPASVRGFCSWLLHFSSNRAWLETVQREQ